MKSTQSLAVCMVVLLACWSGVHVDAQTGALTATTTATLAKVQYPFSSAVSCSSASVVSYGGSAVAYANSNANAISAAASACAKAVASAFATAGSECSGSAVDVFIYTAAQACAQSSLKLRTSAVATARSKGKSFAASTACAYSSAYSSAFAIAIADAFAVAFAEKDGTKCYTSNDVEAAAMVGAVAKAMTSGFAGSYVYSATVGKGSAVAAASSVLIADVSVYASAIATVTSYACSKCKHRCTFCDLGFVYGDDATTTSLASVAAGRYALAAAFSDALSAVCHKQVTIQAAVQALLLAVTDVCVTITAEACGFVSTSGNAVACEASYSSGTAYAVSKAFGRLVADASALAFKPFTCEAQGFSSITAEVFSKVDVLDVITATQQACRATSGKTVTYDAVAKLTAIIKNTEFAAAFTSAFSYAASTCACAGDGYCCNCAYRSSSCGW